MKYITSLKPIKKNFILFCNNLICLNNFIIQLNNINKI